MAAGGVDWLPAVGALVLGLVLGGIAVWRMRATSGPAPAAAEGSLERRDLAGKRDVLLRQLAELEDAAAKRNPDQLARERYALELDAARVLRELDRLPALGTPAAPPARDPTRGAPDGEGPPRAERPALRGFLWGIGSMAALAGLVFLVTQAARPREEGQPATGELPGGTAPRAANAEEARLQVLVQEDPDDLDARLALAHAYLQRQEMMGVWNETQYVLELSPGHPRALAYQALVRLAMGQPEVALDMLEQAVATAPDLVDAYVPLSVVLMRLGRPEDAARTMAEAKRRFPERAEALDLFEDRLHAAAEQGPARLEGDPHEGIGAPGRAVSGTIDLDPTLRGQVSSGVLYLMVREAGVEGGPPLAVQRLVPRSLPLRFEIGEADSMTGDALPDLLVVEARLDADGDPATRPVTDPRARQDGVALGAGDLALILRRE